MRTFLVFVMKSRYHAMGASATFAALSFLIPPLSYVSGAIVGLATLRNGTLEGGLVILGSAVITGILLALQLGTPAVVLVFAAVSWLPIWILASLLRGPATLATALAAAATCAASIVFGFYLSLGDPVEWWRPVLEDFYRHLAASGMLGPDASGPARLADIFAPLMTGVLAAGFMLGFVLTLFLARWWHAILDNPGGFSREFRTLRLGPRTGIAALVVVVAAAVGGGAIGGLGRDLLWTVVALYTFQGLALVHALVALRGGSVVWLVVLYLLLVFAGQFAIPMLAVAGYMETWVRLRDRAGGNTT